jgi:hypothetical protein
LKVNTDEIEAALTVGLYYLAVASSLALPDICGALENPDGKATSQRYKDWFEIWLAAKYPNITGDDMYRLRCGVVHEGRFDHPSMAYDAIAFVIPGSRFHMHNCIFENNGGVQEKIMVLDPVQFCRDVIAAVAVWMAAKQNDPNVQANIQRLVQYRPQGIPPQFRGIPCIV